jgi:hypothetical protein
MDKAQRTMLFNPYSGKPRDPRDIASDPAGALMVDPDEPLYAARKAQPPSASGEREAFVKWLSGTYPDIYPVEDAERRWSQEHISALAWEARAALAPSPGIDAAGQKPVAWLTSDGKVLVFADKISNGRARHSGMTPLYAAPPAAQPSAEWEQEAARLVAKYGDECHEAANSGFIAKMVVARAALLAHLRTKGDANG